MGEQRLHVPTAGEWRRTREHSERKASEGVHIAGRRRGRAPDDLGRQIVDRAEGLARASEDRVARCAGQPEIPERRGTISFEEHVRRLHVAMDDARDMERVEAGRHLLDQSDRLANRQERTLVEGRRQRPSGHVPTHQVWTTVRRAHAQHGDQVGVADRGDDPALVLEPLSKDGIARGRAAQDLDGDHAIVAGATGSVNDSRRPGPYHRVDAISREFGARRQLLRQARLRTHGLVGYCAMAPWPSLPLAMASRELAAAAAPAALHPEETVARLMLAMAVVIVAARLAGIGVARLGQPRVMGEVLAGILLGPTLLGKVAPGVEMYLFPPEIIPLLAAAANIGLAFYMFLVGLELDPRLLRGRVRQAAIVSNVSVLIPMIVGGLLAAALYSSFAPPGVPFVPFALFIGVSMSVTAFPVLARILVERGMLQRPIGALALAAAAVDDVSAWLLLALATAAATAAAGMNACAEASACAPTDPVLGVVRVLGLVVLFCVFMGLVIRRLLVRVSEAFDSAGRLPLAWVGAIFVGVLLATSAAGLIGVAPIFGAFVFGLVMPRGEAIARDVARRLEDFVAIVLLPLFFVVAGLRANIGLIQGPGLILLTVGIIAVAIVGKLFAAAGAARLTGMSWRESAAVGTLMNTRGLTELIVLTVGLSYGVIGEDLFTMLVIMALVTTFMTSPLLRLIDPTGALTTSPIEAVEVPSLEPAPAAAASSLLVACIDDQNLDSLLAIAVPLATAEPPREVVALRVVEPSPFAAGLSALEERVRQAEVMLDRRRRALAGSIRLRTAVLTSVRPDRDLVRLANRPGVDLVLVDGRPPLLGDGPIGGPVRVLLEDVACDVAVLVRRPDHHPDLVLRGAVVVPFGGADQDWAAVELGAWLATTSGVPLRLVGVAKGEDRDPSRLLVNASVVVQQLTGVVPETRLVVAGEMSLDDAMTGGSLTLVGLSDRWREEGLGPVRTELARTSDLPVLFVRRGTKPGALAPRDDLTRFSWSFVGREGRTPASGGVGNA